MAFTKFTDEQINAAKNMSTVDVIHQYTGYDFKRMGREWKCKEHDSLVVFADGKGWVWYSQDIKGASAIDWLTKVERMSFPEAMQALIGGSVPSISQLDITSSPQQPKELILPPKATTRYTNVYMYLTEHRGIAPEIVKQCFKDDIIYQDDHNNCVFIGYDENKQPKYASKRGTYTFPGAKTYKRDCQGSDKTYGFVMQGSVASHVYVFEAPIDALSHATLTLEKSKGLGREDYLTSWRKHTRIALGGVSDAALKRYLDAHKDVKEISFCLDNDEAGIKAAASHKAKYEQLGYTVNVYTVPNSMGKDYNEFLCLYRESKKQLENTRSATANQQYADKKTYSRKR